MKRQCGLYCILSGNWYRFSSWVLAICCCAGFAVGILAAIHSGSSLIPLMCSAVSRSVSISGLMIVVLLPFLFSALAVSFSESWLLPLICSYKFFSFGYCACGVSLAFGQCSWLLQFLLLFSDCMSIPVLYLFCMRNLKRKSSRFRIELFLLSGWCALVVLADYRFISPLLASLFT